VRPRCPLRTAPGAGPEGQIAGLAYLAIGKCVDARYLLPTGADHGGEFAKLFAGGKWVNVSIDQGRSRTSFARASSKPKMLRKLREIAGSVT
jgi:hypothetical protein